MSTIKLVLLLACVAAGFVSGAYGIAYLAASRVTADYAGPVPLGVPADAVTSELGVPSTRAQIAFWSKRAADRRDAYLDLTLLGEAYARRGRETSDVSYYSRAEEA